VNRGGGEVGISTQLVSRFDYLSTRKVAMCDQFVVYWSELLTTDHKVPGSKKKSRFYQGDFLKWKIPMVIMVWVV
jgi:hypothetical protein